MKSPSKSVALAALVAVLALLFVPSSVRAQTVSGPVLKHVLSQDKGWRETRTGIWEKTIVGIDGDFKVSFVKGDEVSWYVVSFVCVADGRTRTVFWHNESVLTHVVTCGDTPRDVSTFPHFFYDLPKEALEPVERRNQPRIYIEPGRERFIG